MKNIVVATKANVGYYNILIESCKKNNIDLIVLGLGKKWTGFTMRFKLWSDYLNKLDENEIVMINDAYDVIILQNSNHILQKFKNFNKKIVFSIQSGLFTNLLFAQSIKCTENIICMGNMIGYVKYLKQFIKLLFKYPNIWEKYNNDDQMVINKYVCNKEQSFFNKYISIDKNQELFFVTTGDNLYKLPYLFEKRINGLFMKNGKLFNKRNIEPSILHLAGNIDGNKYLRYLGYNVKNITIHGTYKIKQVLNFLLLFFKKYILIILIILFVILKKIRK